MDIVDYKLFTIGPTQMYPSTLEVRGHVVPYFRTPEFSKMMLESVDILKRIQGAEDDAEVIVLTASGSAAMEATVMNCFDTRDKLLVINGGTFGERFVRICEIHGIPHEVIRLDVDEELTKSHLEPFRNQGFTGLLINIDETSTGQLYDIDLLSHFCQEEGLLFVVDAISSFLCDPYEAAAHHVDATIVSSQKGLCIAPGLSLVTLSPRMVGRLGDIDPKSLYFDFKDYISNIKRGQTPFTPAVGVCFELADMLHKIDQQGVDARVAEVRERADYFRNLIKDLPVRIPEFPLSNAVTPVIFEDGMAMGLFAHLKDTCHLMINPSGGALAGSRIRVSHVGDLALSDYDELVNEIKAYLERG